MFAILHPPIHSFLAFIALTPIMRIAFAYYVLLESVIGKYKGSENEGKRSKRILFSLQPSHLNLAVADSQIIMWYSHDPTGPSHCPYRLRLAMASYYPRIWVLCRSSEALPTLSRLCQWSLSNSFQNPSQVPSISYWDSKSIFSLLILLCCFANSSLSSIMLN